jgi:hypothetical protein
MPIRLLISMLLAAATVVVGGVPAAAHTPAAQADTLLAQSIAGMDLTLAVRRPGRVPGPLRVDVIAHTPVRAVPIAVTVRSATSVTAEAGTVELEQGVARTYPVVLAVQEEGAHWLELRVDGEFSQLPFRVTVPRAAGADLWISGAFAVAALLLAAGLATGLRGLRTMPVLLGGGGTAAMVVGITIAALSPMLTPIDEGTAAVAAGRPYAQGRIETVPERPTAGTGFTLRLTLVDGSTGRPVDDLAPHHQALAHTVVTSADGTEFHHVHPVRTAPGRLEVRLTAARAGTYRVDVEFERETAGSQLVSGRFDVTGTAPAVSPAAVPATLPTPHPVVAGRPVSVEIDTGPGRLQPWLGMAGHLIVRDDAGDFLGHAHEQASMATDVVPPDDTVPAYGPVLRFGFTFPEPGRYFVWVQYARDLTVVTVPYTVLVEAARS